MRLLACAPPCLVVIILVCPAGADVIYVDHGTKGPPFDGTTWCSAFHDLQDAFAKAIGGDEIRVAGGSYWPDRATGDREASFRLPDGVSILGGYHGCGAPDPDRRELSTWITFLVGDLNLDDQLDFVNRLDNSYNVVVAEGVGSDTVLEKFVIRGGYANGKLPSDAYGGGLYIGSGEPVIRDCIFFDNRTEFGGGGLYESDSSALVDGCIFLGNQGRSGGGMFAGGTPIVRNCWFNDNEAQYGGGLFVNTQASAVVQGSRFSLNIATFNGGGVGTGIGAVVDMQRCTINNNMASGGAGLALDGPFELRNSLIAFNNAASAGGGVYTFALDPVAQSITNCTIARNTAGFAGGGVRYWNHASSLGVRNSIIWNNTVAGKRSLDAQISQELGTILVRHSCIDGWINGPGEGNIGSDPGFVEERVDPGQTGGGFRLRAGSPAVNSGDPQFPAIGTDLDLDVRERVRCGRVDMGAYEFRLGDVNCDLRIDLDDFSWWAFCETGPDGSSSSLPECDVLNLTDRPFPARVDLRDFAAFQQAFWP